MKSGLSSQGPKIMLYSNFRVKCLPDSICFIFVDNFYTFLLWASLRLIDSYSWPMLKMSFFVCMEHTGGAYEWGNVWKWWFDCTNAYMHSDHLKISNAATTTGLLVACTIHWVLSIEFPKRNIHFNIWLMTIWLAKRNGYEKLLCPCNIMFRRYSARIFCMRLFDRYQQMCDMLGEKRFSTAFDSFFHQHSRDRISLEKWGFHFFS